MAEARDRVDPVAELINELSKLPSIGEKSASRLAFFLMKGNESYARKLSECILRVKNEICMCDICNNFTSENPCKICSDARRERKLVCVVENPSDLWAVERTGYFKGVYHVLHGLISPIAGIGPNDLKLTSLLTRIEKKPEDFEVVLALSPTVEGEATSMYIKKLLEPISVKITKIAYGIPMGSDIEYIDKLTLSKALEFRRVYE
jgi:recombination protein RecR